MVEENISQKLKIQMKQEIKQNVLISRKHRKVHTSLNYIEHFLILASTITQKY